jgi:hypothetical protein
VVGSIQVTNPVGRGMSNEMRHEVGDASAPSSSV